MNGISSARIASGLLTCMLLMSCSVEETANTTNMNVISDVVAIGTYTREEGHVHGKAEGLYLYSFDRETGEMAHLHTADSIINPSYVTIHPNGKWLFAVSEKGGQEQGKVFSYRISEDKTTLTPINVVASEGNHPCFISVHSSGNFLLVANYGGTVSVIPIDSDGRLSDASSVVTHEGSGPTNRQNSAHAHMITDHPNGYIYAADLGADKLFIYDFDEETGELIPAGEAEVNLGGGPRHFTYHEALSTFYILNELNGTIEVFHGESPTELNRIQSLRAVDEESEQPSSADIHIHPNGSFLYASHRGDVNSISIFRIDEEDGTLSVIGHQSSMGNAPRNFVIHPSGYFLLTANQNSSTVAVFLINPETGELTETGVLNDVPTPVSLKFISL